MQRILSKRVLRDIRENLLRYLALFFLVAMVMYMVVAIVGASETIMQGTEESAAVHHREDGQFGVFVPLTDSEVTQITDKGVTVQQDFSLDFHQGQATLRIYQAREKIDLFAPEQGAELPMQGEILLEQHYAEKHELGLGDTLTVGGRDFIVTGIGSTPDYDAAYEKTSDTTVDSNLCAIASLTTDLKVIGKLKDADKIRVSKLAMVALLIAGILISNIPGLTVTHMFLFYGTLRATTMLPTMLTLLKVKLTSNGVVAGIITSFAVGLPIFACGTVFDIPEYKTIGSLLTVLLAGFVAVLMSAWRKVHGKSIG